MAVNKKPGGKGTPAKAPTPGTKPQPKPPVPPIKPMPGKPSIPQKPKTMPGKPGKKTMPKQMPAKPGSGGGKLRPLPVKPGDPKGGLKTLPYIKGPDGKGKSKSGLMPMPRKGTPSKGLKSLGGSGKKMSGADNANAKSNLRAKSLMSSMSGLKKAPAKKSPMSISGMVGKVNKSLPTATKRQTPSLRGTVGKINKALPGKKK